MTYRYVIYILWYIGTSYISYYVDLDIIHINTHLSIYLPLSSTSVFFSIYYLSVYLSVYLFRYIYTEVIVS